MIDVIIPAHEKDIDTLDLCIDAVKNNVNRLGKVYVISRERLTENAEWIPESEFPFSIDDVSNFTGKHWRTCWYYQQLLKMYVFEVRKDISDSVLVLDSDTVFLNKTDFKVLAWYNNPIQTKISGLKNCYFICKFPMQSTSTEKFSVYIYIKDKDLVERNETTMDKDF